MKARIDTFFDTSRYAPDPPGKYRLARSLSPIDADSLLDPRFAPGQDHDHNH